VTADPVVEFDLALGGLGFEVRGDRANLECHVTTSCYSSYRRISFLDYTALQVYVNSRRQKEKSFSAGVELLASSCRQRPCGEKSTAGIIGPNAPILPFMHRITARPD